MDNRWTNDGPTSAITAYLALKRTSDNFDNLKAFSFVFIYST